MDAERFDRLVESLTRSGSRRSALRALAGVLVGVGGGGLAAEDSLGKNGGKSGRKQKRRKRQRPRALAAARGCYSTTKCPIGANKNARGCNFAGSTLFTAGLNLRLFNASDANFRGVKAAANFTQANLSDACLVDADFSGATLARANTAGAILCRTRMPGGSIDNSGCGNGTPCCPTCLPIGESGCTLGGSCCGGAVCAGDGVCVCPDGLTNCGGRCVDLTSDVNHCAVCGNQCPPSLPNATVECGFGDDGSGNQELGCLYTCEGTFEDCDGDWRNGCEVQLSGNNDHCGTCMTTNCAASGKICKGCGCAEPDGLATRCDDVRNAKLIRGR